MKSLFSEILRLGPNSTKTRCYVIHKIRLVLAKKYGMINDEDIAFQTLEDSVFAIF